MIDQLRAALNRRQLLELGGIAAAGAVFEGAAGCSSVVRRDVIAEPTSTRGLPGPLVEILHDAALAPSSHNSQPWRVVVHDPDHLAIHADLARTLPEIDPVGRELRLSLGAFVENLVISAVAGGRACQVDVAADGDLDRPVADVRFSPCPRAAYPLDRLRQRCTVRSGLRSTALPRELVARLLDADHGAVHFVPGQGAVAASIREATIDAFRQQTADDSAQRELARWMHFSNDAVRGHRDGLTPASMGITGLAGWFVRNFYDEDDVMKPRFRRRSIELTSRQACEAGGWFIVTSPDELPGSVLDAGRRYQRLALLAREHGVGLHPMSQALEEDPYRAQLVGRLGVAGVPQLIVRAGLVDAYPEPVTLRRPVNSFVARA